MKQWNYRVTIFTKNPATNKDEVIVIGNPIGCSGSVTRSLLSSSNTANIDIYNLSLATRNKIYQDPLLEYEQRNKLKIEAGYSEDGTMDTLFFGLINQAYSIKTGGSTEVVTRISAVCMDLFNMSSQTFEAGTEVKDVVKSLANDFPNIALNAFGNITGTLKTDTTFDGNTLEQIQKATGGLAFIDNNDLNVVLLNEVLDTPVPIISNSSVLLDTPVKRDVILDVNFVMQTQLKLGQLLQIESGIYPDFNGQYKVVGFTHKFTFSESVSGQKTTVAHLHTGEGLPFTNVATAGTLQADLSKVKKETVIPVNSNAKAAALEVYKYMQAHNGEIPDKYIITGSSTVNDQYMTRIKTSGLAMKWKDFLGHDNTAQERLKEADISVLSNVYVLAQNAYRVLEKYYKNGKIKVTSGWRSTRNNSKAGGVANSKHLKGLAMDFHIEGVPVSKTRDIMKKVWQGGIGYVYAGKNFVHIQVDSSTKLINDV